MRNTDSHHEAQQEQPGTTLSWAVMATPVGDLTVVASEAGLCRVSFSRPERLLAELDGTLLLESHAPEPGSAVTEPGRAATEACAQLDEYFAGRRREFTVAVDWSFGAGFRLHILRKLYDDVPFGSTVSYAGLAELGGRPSAARSVGAIMGSNPVPIIVPCHRVLASGGGMGGYGPGLEIKRKLLVLEGVLEANLLDDLLPG